MLQSLYINNFVLIDNLDIHFTDGFSVITGETGAGKSIILGALALVLGQRADARSVRKDANKCVIEATFDISKYQLDAFFLENDLEFDAETCLLRRELYASGKSRAFVNDSPVSLSILKELGARLIDIHSQHQNLLLGDNQFQLKVIDVMAENEILLILYRKEFSRYQALRQEVEALRQEAEALRQEEDYIRFQLEQLEEAHLKPGEQEELEREQEALEHAEEIKSSLYKINQLLEGEETSCARILKEALSEAENIERYYAPARETIERLHSAYVDLRDLAQETGSAQEDVEFNPERLEWIHERLNTIYTLQQKHHVRSIEELLNLQNEYQTRLSDIDSIDERIHQAERDLSSSRQELERQAHVISGQRQVAAEEISRRLVALISTLGMPNTRFRIDFQPREEPRADGMDDIQFLFAANRNAELMPVAQTASGGEISRLMLCIKAMIAGFTALPTLIFDEIDTGVSGDIADKMGDIMRDLGSKMQVLAITHLPQIAAKGSAHYYVYKEDVGPETLTRIRPLTSEERVREIARMLSGATLTEASLANARDLLSFSGKN